MSNRIYGTRTDINEQEVRDFYNKRAALASSMKNPLSAVVNGEQNPEQADTRSRFDREYIVPRLDLTQNSAVLDIAAEWEDLPKWCFHYAEGIWAQISLRR